MMKVLIATSCLLVVAMASHSIHHHYPQHIPVIGHNGVPLEPAEVVHARQSHLAIVAETKAHRGHDSYDNGQDSGSYGGNYAGSYGADSGSGHYSSGHEYAHHYPIHSYAVIGHDGKPQETPEVVALKHAHFAAHAEAKSRVGAHGSSYGGSYGGSYGYGSGHGLNHGSAYENHVVHVAPIHHASHHHGGYHIPIIGHNGVPLDTPEVAAARQHHLAALAEASARSHGHHY